MPTERIPTLGDDDKLAAKFLPATTETISGAQTKVDAAAASAAAALSAHAGSTSVHGIANTALLETTSGAQAKATAAEHAAKTASLAKEQNLNDLPDKAVARNNLALGNAATRNVGNSAGTVAAGDDPRFAGLEGGGEPTPVSPFILDLGLEGVPYDGVTDGLAAAQAVIDGAPAGSTIIFPPGVLLVSGTLLLRPQLRYQGAVAFGSTIKLMNGATNVKAVLASAGWAVPAGAQIWTGESLHLENLNVDGNKANTTGTTHGIVLMNWYSSISRCEVTKCSGDGIHLADSDSAGVVLRNTSVENRVTENRITYCEGDGIHVESTPALEGDPGGHSLTDGYCTDNIVGECSGIAIRIKRGAGWAVSRNHTYANQVETSPGVFTKVGKSAIWVSAGFATQITGNYVDGFGQGATSSDVFGIRLDQIGNTSSVVQGNIIEARATPIVSNVYRYLFVEAGGGATGAAVSLVGNTIQGKAASNERGIELYAPGGASLVVDEAHNNMVGIQTANQLLKDGPVTVETRVRGNLVVDGTLTAVGVGGEGGGTDAPVYNLKNLGVPYDGTDGSAAAQAIIDAAAATPGSVIEFSPGTLTVATTLRLRAGLHYRGHGVSKSVIQLASTATGQLAVMASQDWVVPPSGSPVGGEPIIVEDILIRGNKDVTGAANPACTGLVVMNGRSTIRDIAVDQAPSHGIVLTDRNSAGVNLTNTINECRIERNFLRRCGGDGILVEKFANGATDGYCIGNVANACTGHGIYLKNGAGWVVRDNHTYTGRTTPSDPATGLGETGIRVSSAFATDVSNNYIDYYGLRKHDDATARYYSGIRVDFGGNTGRGSTIHGNRINAPLNPEKALVPGYFYQHLAVTTASNTISGVSIKDNFIQGSGSTNGVGTAHETGLRIEVGASAQFTIEESGNTISVVPTATHRVVTGSPTFFGTRVRGNLVVDGTITAGAIEGASTGTATATQRGLYGGDLVANTLGTSTYPHPGSSIGAMLSDGGRLTGQGLRTIYDAHEVELTYGNFQSQQQQPGELASVNPIRVSAALVYPWGDSVRYTSGVPTYSAATSYNAGQMVVHTVTINNVATPQWFMSLQGSNSNHTPGAVGQDAWWQLCNVVPVYFNGSRTVDIQPGARATSDRAGITVAGQTRVGVMTLVEPLTRSGVPVGSVTSSVAFNSATTYAKAAVVVSGGRYYESLVDGNLNHTPVANGPYNSGAPDTWWSPIVYPAGLPAYPQAGTQPDVMYVTAAAAGGGRPTDYTTVAPTTQGATSAASGYGPIAVGMRLASSVGVKPVIGHVGDSIAEGANGSTIFVNEKGSFLAIAANGAYSTLRVNKSGDGFKNWFTASGAVRSGRSQSWALISSATHVICEMGVNDIVSAGSLAQMQVYMLAMWRELRLRRIRVWQTTITPVTNTNVVDPANRWATLAEQSAATAFAPGGTRELVNTWLRANAPIDPSTGVAVAVGTSGALLAGHASHPLYGVIDSAATVQDPNGWAWKTNGTPNMYTNDGTHPTVAGHTLMAAAIDMAAIAAVPALT